MPNFGNWAGPAQMGSFQQKVGEPCDDMESNCGVAWMEREETKSFTELVLPLYAEV